ncbi:Tfp pilus assembly protein FimT/FimU [Methylobacterium sp. J-076]|uniref:pilus assembly FimT family protein n=1 Tax=Methylobacterium sp. J-076 TaxID=2836655 RepID=UPI001FBBCAE2|nr:GspH/FimT family pseudopilin [Methylobacterium sp. J-076]MCJ2015119.1 GspH/FimT family pseudopilin [Methylobacterium sp. J-076]
MSAGRSGQGAGGDAGFTLVEMLVTLVIVGIAASVAFQFAGAGSAGGRRAARLSTALGAEIGLLRAQAIRSGQPTQLVFEAATGRFFSSRPGAAPIATAPLPILVQVEETPSATPGEIRFLPDGGSSGGRIVIGSARDGAVLTVGALIGRARREAAP